MQTGEAQGVARQWILVHPNSAVGGSHQGQRGCLSGGRSEIHATRSHAIPAESLRPAHDLRSGMRRHALHA
jgi:hypothetical protein